MTDAPQDRIAFIGLGTMGEPMVRQLALAGFTPSVFDLNSEAATRIAKRSASTGMSSGRSRRGGMSTGMVLNL